MMARNANCSAAGLLLAVASVMAGCATQPETPSPEPAVALAVPVVPIVPAAPAAPAIVKDLRAPVAEVAPLLAWFERVRRLPGAELTREHEAARLAYAREASDTNRISYAMLLALPGTAFMDDGRALDLLDPVVKRSEATLRGLATMLITFIQERRKLRGDLGAMQQKLDALKSLERNLIERDQNNTGRK